MGVAAPPRRLFITNELYVSTFTLEKNINLGSIVMTRNISGKMVDGPDLDAGALMKTLDTLLQQKKVLKGQTMANDQKGTSDYGKTSENSPCYQQFLELDEQISEIFQAFYSEEK